MTSMFLCDRLSFLETNYDFKLSDPESNTMLLFLLPHFSPCLHF